MPKKPRTQEEIEQVKQNILNKALELINEDGYDNFTMRKLAKKLDMTATPIYQYYKNKDELYLAVLTQGFEELYNNVSEIYNLTNDPMERLKLMCYEHIKFGIYNANFYNIMFVFDLPKYNDYVKTPIENAAFLEYESAIKVRDIWEKIIVESGIIKDCNIRSEKVYIAILNFLCSMHGFITFLNNNVIEYLFELDIDNIKDKIFEQYVDTSIMMLEGFLNQSI